MNKRTALVLLSGGLDSALAVKLVMEQGVECIALNFTSSFCTCDYGGKCFSKEIAHNLNIEYRTIAKGEDFLEVIRNPKHGYGQGLNPCVDCKIYILKKAGELMKEIGADFIVTGEVLGQRPMSQHKRALKVIEEEAGLAGYILRPLSANKLPPTVPEQEGWVEREKLLAIHGRGRKEQLELARNFDIDTYSCAGGGCLLTEKRYALKLKDLFDHNEQVTGRDVQLLKKGRHFRLNERSKVIVGRNEADNNYLKAIRSGDELLFDCPGYGSPLTLLQGEVNEESIAFAAKLTLLYSDYSSKNGEGKEALVVYGKESLDSEIVADPFSKEEAAEYNLTLKRFGNKKRIVEAIGK